MANRAPDGANKSSSDDCAYPIRLDNMVHMGLGDGCGRWVAIKKSSNNSLLDRGGANGWEADIR